MPKDYTPAATEVVTPLLAPGEKVLSVLPLDRNQLLVGLLGGIAAQAVAGALEGSSGKLPFSKSNVAVLTDQRLIVLPRRGRGVGKKPYGAVPLSAVESVVAGKTFDRRPTITLTPVGGKKVKLITNGLASGPFAEAFVSARPSS